MATMFLDSYHFRFTRLLQHLCPQLGGDDIECQYLASRIRQMFKRQQWQEAESWIHGYLHGGHHSIILGRIVIPRGIHAMGMDKVISPVNTPKLANSHIQWSLAGAITSDQWQVRQMLCTHHLNERITDYNDSLLELVIRAWSNDQYQHSQQ